MKKAKSVRHVGEMRAEYDFTRGVRGKYAQRFSEGTNVVVLDPDVAELFPDSAAVNSALRTLAEIAARQRKRARNRRRRI